MSARLCFALVTLAVASGCASLPKTVAPQLDLKIVGGRVVDGTGAPWFRADVGVRGDTIVAIGDLADVPAAEVIDGHDAVVAPGFIDLLGHSEGSVLRDPTLEGKVRQGVTTEVTGEGHSPGPVTEEQRKDREASGRPAWSTLGGYMKVVEKQGTALNFALLVGSSSVREIVMGDVARDPTPDEMRRMEELTDQAMREGAIGLSTALIYVPAVFSKTPEIVALAKVAAKYHGVYFTHIRSESDEIFSALDEAFEIGREAGIPVNIWHLKLSGKENWGRMPEVVAKIESERAKGLDVAANVYPYTASSTGLSALAPNWTLEGGYRAFLERLKDPKMRAKIGAEIRASSFYNRINGPSGVLITQIPNPDLAKYQNKRLSEIAEMMQLDPIETLLRIFEASPISPSAIYFSMSEDDLQEALRQPWVSVGSDSGSVPPSRRKVGVHPRAYGTFPRVIGHYVRDEHLFSLEEAVRKMTSQAASRAHIFDRGILRPGMKADIVIFDPATVRDLATFEDPHQFSVGISDVIVNGVPVLRAGEITGKLPGRILRGSGAAREH